MLFIVAILFFFINLCFQLLSSLEWNESIFKKKIIDQMFVLIIRTLKKFMITFIVWTFLIYL